jgi:hypothetical protein
MHFSTSELHINFIFRFFECFSLSVVNILVFDAWSTIVTIHKNKRTTGIKNHCKLQSTDRHVSCEVTVIDISKFDGLLMLHFQSVFSLQKNCCITLIASEFIFAGDLEQANFVQLKQGSLVLD